MTLRAIGAANVLGCRVGGAARDGGFSRGKFIETGTPGAADGLIRRDAQTAQSGGACDRRDADAKYDGRAICNRKDAVLGSGCVGMTSGTISGEFGSCETSRCYR